MARPTQQGRRILSRGGFRLQSQMFVEGLAQLFDDRIQFGGVVGRKSFDDEIFYSVLQSSLRHGDPRTNIAGDYRQVGSVVKSSRNRMPRRRVG
jgi:hypothetical protein